MHISHTAHQLCEYFAGFALGHVRLISIEEVGEEVAAECQLRHYVGEAALGEGLHELEHVLAVSAESVVDSSLAHVLLLGEPLVCARFDGLDGNTHARYLVPAGVDCVLRSFTDPLHDLVLFQLGAEAL